MSSLDEAAVTDEQPARGADPLVPRTRAPSLEIIGLLVLPLVLYILLEVEPFFLQNGIDPFIYVGYIENQADLIDRFGYTYFSVRFGLILPARLATSLFGPVLGHFMLRYALALVAAVPVFLLGRRHGSRAAGWCGAVFCLSSPVFLRALMTAYADTTGLPCLLGGFACLLMPSRHRLRWAGLAGALFGIAIHSNPFLISVITVACVARLALQLVRGERSALLDYLCAVGGVLAVTILGTAYYWVAFGDPNIFGPSIDALRTYSGELARYFRSPTHEWLGFSPHLYMPLVVGLAMVVLVLTRPVTALAGHVRTWLAPPLPDALVMLAVVQIFYVVQQFVLDGYALETYYYASYLFAFVVLGVTASVIELARRPGLPGWSVWLAVGVVVGLPFLRNLAFEGLQLWAWPTVPLMLGAVAVAIAVAVWKPALGMLPAVVLLGSLALLGVAPPRNVPLSAGQAFRYDPNYQAAIGNGSLTGLEWYDVASQLIEATPKWDQTPGSVVFWYRNEPNLLNGIQATYLWRASTVQEGNAGLPMISDLQRSILLGRTPPFIMMLATDPADLEVGQRALEGIGMVPIDERAGELDSGSTTVYTKLLTFRAAGCDQEWRAPVPWLGQSPCR